MKLRCLLFLTLLASTAAAQKTEVGGFAGIGGFAADDMSTTTFWVAGAEACFLCDGRFAIFAEYNHYGSAGNKFQVKITSVDLISGGLRVQRPKGRVRPFVDVGISGGQDRFQRSSGSDGSHGLIGLALGGGATIAVGKRWYVRPAVRFQGMSGFHVGASVAASIGYRF